MALTLAEKLAKLLGLPIEVIQAYGKRQDSEAEPPSAHYATLKEQVVPPPAEETASRKTGENELYTQWRDASEEEKPELEKKLFRALVAHSGRVIWQMMHEHNPELEALARDIASDAMRNLSLRQFKEQSKFSTYVQGIAKNKIFEEMERRVNRKERFYVSKNPEEDVKLKDPKAEAAFNRVEEGADLARLERLVKELRGKDYVLLQCQLEGMTMAETAQKLGDSEDAAESRWRRVKGHLKRKIRENPDGK